MDLSEKWENECKVSEFLDELHWKTEDEKMSLYELIMNNYKNKER